MIKSFFFNYRIQKGTLRVLLGVVSQAEVNVPAEGDDVSPKDAELRRDVLESNELDGHPDLGRGDGDGNELLSELIIQLIPGSVEESHVDVVDDEENGRPNDLIDRQLNQHYGQSTLSSEDLIQENVPPVHHLSAEKSKAR